MAQSTVFTHTIPAGFNTDAVLPSLMTGQQAEKVRSSGSGQLQLYLRPNSASPHWQSFDPTNTVFADAQALGYRTAIAGWFNPYCRILPNMLDHCFWTNQTLFDLTFPYPNIHQNLFRPLVHLYYQAQSFLLHTPQPDQLLYPQTHIADYQNLYSAADQLIADQSLNFVLLHLPLPHPGGIYDRHRRTLTTANSTYIDNIALVDLYLTHLRDVLQQQHRWDTAAIVIMGGHSWRTSIWSTQPNWTDIEQHATHNGYFDDRPFYAVKLPNQISPAQFNMPFRAIETKDLIDTLLRRQLQTPAQLQAWANEPH